MYEMYLNDKQDKLMFIISLTLLYLINQHNLRADFSTYFLREPEMSRIINVPGGIFSYKKINFIFLQI